MLPSSHFPTLPPLLSLITCMSYLHVLFLDEKEMGEDEGATKEIESENKSEEQPPQEEEEELVPEQEAEKEPEQSLSAPCETEPQSS